MAAAAPLATPNFDNTIASIKILFKSEEVDLKISQPLTDDNAVLQITISKNDEQAWLDFFGNTGWKSAIDGRFKALFRKNPKILSQLSGFTNNSLSFQIPIAALGGDDHFKLVDGDLPNHEKNILINYLRFLRDGKIDFLDDVSETKFLPPGARPKVEVAPLQPFNKEGFKRGDYALFDSNSEGFQCARSLVAIFNLLHSNQEPKSKKHKFIYASPDAFFLTESAYRDDYFGRNHRKPTEDEVVSNSTYSKLKRIIKCIHYDILDEVKGQLLELGANSKLDLSIAPMEFPCKIFAILNLVGHFALMILDVSKDKKIVGLEIVDTYYSEAFWEGREKELIKAFKEYNGNDDDIYYEVNALHTQSDTKTCGVRAVQEAVRRIYELGFEDDAGLIKLIAEIILNKSSGFDDDNFRKLLYYIQWCINNNYEHTSLREHLTNEIFPVVDNLSPKGTFYDFPLGSIVKSKIAPIFSDIGSLNDCNLRLFGCFHPTFPVQPKHFENLEIKLSLKLNDNKDFAKLEQRFNAFYEKHQDLFLVHSIKLNPDNTVEILLQLKVNEIDPKNPGEVIPLYSDVRTFAELLLDFTKYICDKVDKKIEEAPKDLVSFLRTAFNASTASAFPICAAQSGSFFASAESLVADPIEGMTIKKDKDNDILYQNKVFNPDDKKSIFTAFAIGLIPFLKTELSTDHGEQTIINFLKNEFATKHCYPMDDDFDINEFIASIKTFDFDFPGRSMKLLTNFVKLLKWLVLDTLLTSSDDKEGIKKLAEMFKVALKIDRKYEVGSEKDQGCIILEKVGGSNWICIQEARISAKDLVVTANTMAPN